MSRNEECLHCRTHHANPTTFDAYPDWHASPEDVEAAQADPERYVRMWEQAADAMTAAHEVVRSLKKYRRTLRQGSPEYRRMAAVINQAGAAACKAQEACWRLPHPSQTLNQRIGCL